MKSWIKAEENMFQFVEHVENKIRRLWKQVFNTAETSFDDSDEWRDVCKMLAFFPVHELNLFAFVLLPSIPRHYVFNSFIQRLVYQVLFLRRYAHFTYAVLGI